MQQGCIRNIIRTRGKLSSVRVNHWINRSRILLTAVAAGLVAVYVWQSLSFAIWGPPVELPKAQSGRILEVEIESEETEEPIYFCDEFADENERASCLYQLVFEGRDLSLYNSGGRLGCGIREKEADPISCERSVEKARRFIWEHWKMRKRGYLSVARSSGGHEGVTHFFIEPGFEGRWRIVENRVPMLKNPVDPEHYLLGDLIEVRWKRASTDWETK